MRRAYVPRYTKGVYRHYSMFKWYRCCSCGKEFRREKGYRFLGDPVHGGMGVWYYLCNSCAPTKQRAHEVALNQPPRPRPRPIVPPPPPTPKR